MKKIILFFFVFVFAACSNTALHRPYSVKTISRDSTDLRASGISDSDVIYINRAIKWHKLQGDSIKAGTSYEQLIAEGKRVGPSALTGNSNPQNQEADRIARLSKSVVMSIFNKGFSRGGKQSLTRFDIAISNKSNQTITAVKGSLVVNSIFGDHLKTYRLKFDDSNIKPGQTIKITRFWEYDKSAWGDQKIISTPLNKLVITWQPEAVFFADGSSLD